jgi:hypothetical protein
VIGIIPVVGAAVTLAGVLTLRLGLTLRLRLASRLGLPLQAGSRFGARRRIRRLLRFWLRCFGLAGGLCLPGALVHAAIDGVPARGVGTRAPFLRDGRRLAG